MNALTLWRFALLAVGTAGIYAILAYSVTITYKATGFVSFANGAVAMVAAYVFIELRGTGLLVVPIPGVKLQVRLGEHSVNVLVALLVAVAFAMLLGGASYLLVFRWLRSSPPLARMVASIGVMVTLQALVVLKFGTNGRSSSALFSQASVTIWGATTGLERIVVFLIAVIVGALLVGVFGHTRFGLKTSAISDSPINAVLVGLNPIRLELANWVVSAALCGLAGCLATSFVALDPSTYTLLIVPALAVAVAGRFGSFGWSLVVGTAIAVLQSESVAMSANWSWFPQQGIPDALPFVFIAVILMVRGRRIPDRSGALTGRLPAVGAPPRIARAVLVWAPIGLVLCLALGGQFRVAFVQSMIVAILCLSVVVITGYLGQVSVAQLAFAGLGAFVLAHALQHWSMPAPLALVVSGLAAVPLGIAIAIPALRIRGLQLTIVTFAAALALDGLLFTNTSISGGFAGMAFRSPTIFGLNIDIRRHGSQPYPRAQFGVFVLIVLVVVAAAVANIRRQPFGRQMLTVRASERVASASGISPERTKLVGFAVASFIAGVGGGVIGFEQSVITADSFTALMSLSLLAVAFLGGVGYVSGAIAGGVMFGASGLAFTILDYFANFNAYQTLVVGLGLIVTAILNPDGSVSVAATFARKVADRTRPPVELPALPSGLRVVRAAAAESAIPVLELSEITVSYGATPAVSAVSLRVDQNEIVGLIGPNGAGKTSLVDAITGFTDAFGSVRLGGVPIAGLRADRIARSGISRTFQSDELLHDMTVLENVLAGVGGGRGLRTLLLDIVRFRVASPPSAALAALDQVGMLGEANRAVRSLNPRERKLAGIARALSQEPKLLILDEPAAGLDAAETGELAVLLQHVRERGTALLVIDHDMDLMMNVCDRIYVLRAGNVIASGAPADISNNDLVVTAYLGPKATSEPRSGVAQS